ncbi:type II toxin-antitoxin system Phd/YefM family antitoxin [Pseudonocardia zijingensis]|uniref:Antitoxin n=1 Tax=Pseudonocardia zijingensis TaxID=153376 RepID=A0ABP3YLB5_9PSEU
MKVGKQVTVREARDNLGRLLDAAHYAGEVTVVTRQGKPWAIIGPLTPEHLAAFEAAQRDEETPD